MSLMNVYEFYKNDYARKFNMKIGIESDKLPVAIIALSTIGFFFTTLHEFYYESPIGFIRIFEFLGVGIWLACIGIYGGRFYHTGIFITCLAIVIFAHVIPLCFSLLVDSSAVYWNTVLGMPISMGMAIVFLYTFSSRGALLLCVCEYTLWIHLVFYYVQFLVFIGTGVVVDYLSLLGREQRMVGGDFTEDSLLRCAGLTGEPAAFALTVVILLAGVCWGSKKIPWVTLIATIGAVVSCFSAMGYFYLAMFSACFIAPRIKSFKVWFVGTLGGGIVAIIGGIIASAQIQKTYEKLVNFQESGSYQYRIGTFLSYVVEDFFGAMLGKGLGVMQLVTLQDGTYVGIGSSYSTILLSCGLVLGAFVFFFIWRLLRKSKVPMLACVFTFALFLGTNTPSQLIFWTWIFGLALICRSHYTRDNTGMVLYQGGVQC